MKKILSGLAMLAGLLPIPPAHAVVGGVALDAQQTQALRPVVQLMVNQLLCTGTIVAPGKILTAAHCLIFADLSIQQPQICIADDSAQSQGCLSAADYGVSMPIATKIQPVLYNDKIYLIRDPDLALITISASSPVLAKVAALPAAIPASVDDSDMQKGSLMIVGEGCTDYATMAGKGQLRFGLINLLTDKTDAEHFYSTYSPGAFGAAACTGDSGGALLRVDAGGAAILYGVTSQEGVFQAGAPTISVFGSIVGSSVHSWLSGAL